jgi:NAD(P)H-dependent FMN reductase
MRLMIIWGSSRPGRKGGPVAYWVKSQAKKDKRFEKVDFVDLQEMTLPFYDEPNSPYGMAEAGEDYSNADGKAWAERVGKADGVIIVTPEYNHNIPAVLKNALDWVGPEWLDKPVGLISYGSSSGGVYAVAALRIICAELGLVNVANAIHFTRYKTTFASKEEPSEYSEQKLDEMFVEISRLREAFSKS